MSSTGSSNTGTGRNENIALGGGGGGWIPAEPEVRIKFGPKPHQTLSREHAEAMLTALAKDAPSTFGLYLRKVIMAELNGARP